MYICIQTYIHKYIHTYPHIHSRRNKNNSDKEPGTQVTDVPVEDVPDVPVEDVPDVPVADVPKPSSDPEKKPGLRLSREQHLVQEMVGLFMSFDHPNIMSEYLCVFMYVCVYKQTDSGPGNGRMCMYVCRWSDCLCRLTIRIS